MNNWRTGLIRMITGVQDLYKQPLPTKLYTGKKIKTTNHKDYTCRMLNSLIVIKHYSHRLNYELFTA